MRTKLPKTAVKERESTYSLEYVIIVNTPCDGISRFAGLAAEKRQIGKEKLVEEQIFCIYNMSIKIGDNGMTQKGMIGLLALRVLQR